MSRVFFIFSGVFRGLNGVSADARENAINAPYGGRALWQSRRGLAYEAGYY
ncbi:MAG: hypothetical protein LUI12_07780 [Clostridiales bacterium]|nr:hypothetical protein [Clostridiales bacterium]